MAKHSINVAGIAFPSLREAAIHFNAHYGNVARRIKGGWTCEEALGLAPHKRKDLGRGTTLTTSAGTFDSIRSASEHFGIASGTIQKRLSDGWTPDQAVGLDQRIRTPKKTKEVTCVGQRYPNSWAMAQAHGKNEKLVAKRLRQGWTSEQAVELEPPPCRFRNQSNGGTNPFWKKVETIDEREYPATELGEYKLYLITNLINEKQYVGITINPLWQRFAGHKRSATKGTNTKLYNAMRLHGVENFTIELLRTDARSFVELQLQEVSEIEKRDTLNKGYNTSPGGSIGTPTHITVGESVFPSRGAAASYFGVEAGVFNMRISRLGWTPEQAAEIEPRGKYSRPRIKVGDVVFLSLAQAAHAHNLNVKLVGERVKEKRWTLEQALEITPPPETVKYLGIKISAYGKDFPSLASIAAHHKTSPEAIKRHMRKGLSPEDALMAIEANKKRLGRKP